LLILVMLTINSFSQVTNISGVYLYDWEYLKIDKDKFKIVFDRYLPERDTIASFGDVEYIDDKFIKLTSDKSYYCSPSESIVFRELYDNTLMDSLRVEFVFPFNGDFDIKIHINNTPLQAITNSKILTIPLSSSSYVSSLRPLRTFSFHIYNRSIIGDGFWGYYLGIVSFPACPPFLLSTTDYSVFSYKFKNKDTNVLVVEIPDLTDSYFARYFINEEYAKVEKDKIIWRGRKYERIK